MVVDDVNESIKSTLDSVGLCADGDDAERVVMMVVVVAMWW